MSIVCYVGILRYIMISMRLHLKTSLFILFLIVIVSTALRIYRLSEMANFDFDQQYASNFAYAVLKEYPIQLIGQGLSIEGLFMGPLYFYILVPFYALSSLHPIGGFIGSICIGIGIIITSFLVVKTIFNDRAGLIAAFYSGLTYASLERDWSMVPAFSAELSVLITWLCLYKYWHEDHRYLILLGFVFGLFTSIHPILFPFYLVFLVFLITKRFVPNPKILFLSIVGFITPLTPLLIFEYLHNFLEVKRLITLFTSGTTESRNIESFFHNLNIVGSSTYNIIFPYLPQQFLFFTTGLIVLFLTLKGVSYWKDRFHLIFLVSAYVSFVLYYTFYPGHVTEYYFLALSVIFMVYTSATLGQFTKKPVFLILVLLILGNQLLNTYQLLDRKWNNQSLITLAHKDAVVKEILKHQQQDQEFYVSYIKEPGWNFGFDYLFKLYGHQPQTREVKQPIYTIVIPKSLSPDSIRFSSGNIGLILPDK